MSRQIWCVANGENPDFPSNLSRPRRESGRTSARASSTVCFGHHRRPRRLRRLDCERAAPRPSRTHCIARTQMQLYRCSASSPIVWQRCALCSVLLLHRNNRIESHADQGRVRRLQRRSGSSSSSHVRPQAQQVATPLGLRQRRSLQSRQPRVLEQLRLGRRHHQAGQVVQVLQGHLRLAQEQPSNARPSPSKSSAITRENIKLD
uniref:Uncharacterized protein n=1 Tax=Trichogramma kaykai TaxID=54128 RepID=A0ABD2VXS0_9HYME